MIGELPIAISLVCIWLHKCESNTAIVTQVSVVAHGPLDSVLF